MLNARASLASLVTGCLALTLAMQPVAAEPIAKRLFGGKKLPAVMQPAVHGFYSKGCVQGAIAIPQDGETWQAMRLSRNRRWGHPATIQTVVKLSQDGKKVGWNGLLVGDISQPRGGPMLTGHASHQIGLDADIWLTQMPNKRLSYREREQLSATSMLNVNKRGQLDQTRINPKTFTKATFGIIKTAASYKQVERVLVHPTIKRELCRIETGDRRWLYKVRPYWGHHYHMHVRLSCPADSPNCRPQAKPRADDGCGKELKDWARLLNPPKPKKTVKKKKPTKVVKRKPKRQIRLRDLPGACTVVLKAPGPVNAKAATLRLAGGQAFLPNPTPSSAASAADSAVLGRVAVPTFRPANP